MLGATGLDEQCRLAGTLDEFRDMDYTDIWNTHLHKRHNGYDELMLNTVFRQQDGRIISAGMLLFMAAYSRPLQFMRYVFR